MAAAVDDTTLSRYRKLLLRLSNQLIREEVEKLKLLSVDHIPRRKLENVHNGLQFFDLLEQDGRISCGNFALLEDMFKTIGREDILSMIQTYKQTDLASSDDVPERTGIQPFCMSDSPQDALSNKAPVKEKTQQATSAELDMIMDGTVLVTDGGGDDSPIDDSGGGKEEDPTTGVSSKARVMLVKEQGAASLLSMNPNLVTSMEGISRSAEQGQKAVVENMPGMREPTRVKKVQSDSALESPAVRYVNFLEHKGYVVEIIGGKHFASPNGEFVEMKSGVQYKICVTNTHQEGCHLDISIDGYDVGGWVLSGFEKLTIERPANESKKFTFYRVKTAPKDSGIASGRSENGLVRCVFTPEAHICVTVDVGGLQQPLQVEVPSFATVGDVKRKAQQELNINNDPNQVIVLENKRLQNEELIRHWFQFMSLPSRKLRLLAVEQEIMLEVSSGERCPLKIHPGESKIFHVMEHIEKVTQVPVSDQKLYHGRCRLSDSPTRLLPDDMICDPNPTLVVIVPKYLHLSVKMEGDQTKPVKIDGKKTLRDLMKEIRPLPREGEEVEVVFDGHCVNPYSDHRSLEDCSLKSGSIIEVKVNRKRVLSVKVRLPTTRAVNIIILPEETFKDLLEKLRMEEPDIKIKGFELIGESKVFDPDQDTKAIEDYGITNDSVLRALVGNLQNEGDLSEKLEELRERCHRDTKSLDLEVSSKKAAKTSRKSVLSSLRRALGRGRRYRGFSESAAGAGGAGGAEEPRPPLLSRDRWSGRLDSAEESYDDVLLNSLPGYDDVLLNSLPGTFNKPKFSGMPPSLRCTGEDTAPVYIETTPSMCVVGSAAASYQSESYTRRVTQVDPAWKAGGTTLQGYSSQLFTPAESLKVDPSRRVELLLRLVAREDEDTGKFPQEECTPLSTLYPPAVSE